LDTFDKQFFGPGWHAVGGFYRTVKDFNITIKKISHLTGAYQ
jgi:hypothetical protein